MYWDEKAEVASASAAGLALKRLRRGRKAKDAGELLLSDHRNGDYGKAIATIRQYVHQYRAMGRDGGAGAGDSVQGNLVEALLASQQAYEEDPYNRDAYGEAKLAMIGMNRFDSVLQLSRGATAGRNPGKRNWPQRISQASES